MKKMPTEVVPEFGCREADGEVWIVTRAFMLNLVGVNGPWEAVQPGQRVRLFRKRGEEAFFAAKVEPEHLGDTFEVIAPFRVIKDRQWLHLERGDVVKMTRAEAVPLLRERKVKERKVADETAKSQELLAK